MSQQLADRPAATSPGAPPPPLRRWVRWVLVVVCLAIAAMWVYALGFAPKKAVYRVDDEGWRDHAEQRCATGRAERVALADTSGGYIDHPTPAQMAQRAGIVDQATDIIESMLDDVVAWPVATERDRDIVRRFETQYRLLLDDRRAYTAQLRTGVDESYRETRVAGGPVTNVLVDFVVVNEIDSCTPPGELGGDV